MVVNTHTSWWQRRKRERLVAEVPDRAAPAGFDADVELKRALDELPPKQRAVVVPRLYEDPSERQTANALGCSVGNVKSQESRAAVRVSALCRGLGVVLVAGAQIRDPHQRRRPGRHE